MIATLLTMRRVSSSRSSGTWADDDYHVIEGERVIGRIYRYDGRIKQTWFWGIDSLLLTRPVYGDVVGTREEAMAAFKAAWGRPKEGWMRQVRLPHQLAASSSSFGMRRPSAPQGRDWKSGIMPCFT